MRKKGFTLIELLAVVVILAIIALIATPIILGIIKDAKENTNKRSIDNYAKAVQNSILKYQLSGKKLEEIIMKTTDGRNFSNVEDFKVEYEGNVVCDTIEIYEDGSIFLAGCKVNEEEVDYTYGELRVYLAQKNPTTGLVPTQDEKGNILPGSEFIIKVNNKMDRLTFFVLSNDGDYVNLIAEQNIAPDGNFTKEIQDNDEWCDNSEKNSSGPQKAYAYLERATKNWVNISAIKDYNYSDEGYIPGTNGCGYQGINTKFDESLQKYITKITPYSSSHGSPVTYENMRARLPYTDEITINTTCSFLSNYSNFGSCPLWMVNYLYSDDTSNQYYNDENGKVSSTGENYGYWLSSSGACSYARTVYHYGNIDGYRTNNNHVGVRPVITVLKSDLLKAM